MMGARLPKATSKTRWPSHEFTKGTTFWKVTANKKSSRQRLTWKMSASGQSSNLLLRFWRAPYRAKRATSSSLSRSQIWTSRCCGVKSRIRKRIFPEHLTWWQCPRSSRKRLETFKAGDRLFLLLLCLRASRALQIKILSLPRLSIQRLQRPPICQNNHRKKSLSQTWTRAVLGPSNRYSKNYSKVTSW